MQLFLREYELKVVRQTLYEAIEEKLSSARSSEENLYMGGDFFATLIEQLVLPIVVSLCSSALYDILKENKLRTFRKKQITEVLQGLLGKGIKLEEPLDAQCLIELREEMAPMGFSDTEILFIYAKVRQKLASLYAEPDDVDLASYHK